MDLLAEHEVEVGRWEPIGVVRVATVDELCTALAELGADLLPALFRCLPADAESGCGYLELGPDGSLLGIRA